MNSNHFLDLTKSYCRAVELEWRNLPADGKNFPLQQVFIMLQSTERVDGDSLKYQKLTPAKDQLAHLEIKQKEQKKPPPTVELSQALGEAQSLVLLGEPGSGKSTTLQFMILYKFDTS